MSQRERFRHRVLEIAKWLMGITTLSGSRWGIFAFFLAMSFFLCAGSGMLEQLLSNCPFWQTFAFCAGVFFFILAVALGIFCLVRGSKDTTAEELRKISKELKEIKDIVEDGVTKKGGEETTKNE